MGLIGSLEIMEFHILYVINFSTKSRFSFHRHRRPKPISTIMFTSISFLAPDEFKMIWISNLLTLSGHVSDETHSRKASCPLHEMPKFLFLNITCTNFQLLVNEEMLHVSCQQLNKQENHIHN